MPHTSLVGISPKGGEGAVLHLLQLFSEYFLGSYIRSLVGALIKSGLAGENLGWPHFGGVL